METWYEEFIQGDQARSATLATVGPDGQPHAVPIVFVYEDGVLFTPLDRKPKRSAPSDLQRVRDLQHNPHATVLIHHYEADWNQLAWVQLRGQGEVLEEGESWQRALELLKVKYPQYAELPLGGRPVISLDVEAVVGWRAKDADK